MKRHLQEKPFKRGHLIVISKGSRLIVGMLWGRGGRERETIQYLPKWRITNLASRLEEDKPIVIKFPSIVYADTKLNRLRGTGDPVVIWDRKMFHYHEDCLSREFREKYNILLSYVTQRYKPKVLFSYG